MTTAPKPDARVALADLLEVVQAAIRAGDWKVDGACEPSAAIAKAERALACKPELLAALTDLIQAGGATLRQLAPRALTRANAAISHAERGS